LRVLVGKLLRLWWQRRPWPDWKFLDDRWRTDEGC